LLHSSVLVFCSWLLAKRMRNEPDIYLYLPMLLGTSVSFSLLGALFTEGFEVACSEYDGDFASIS